MSAKRSVPVSIRGRVFHVRTDGDEEELRRVAAYLDETLERVQRRTGTIDSEDVALLSALNLAREVVELREGGPRESPEQADALRALIELAESALASEAG